MTSDDEDAQLRLVALRNAEETLRARNRAEQELRNAKESLERKNRELEQQREWFQVTLSSIGDAVITTDSRGRVTFLNAIAEKLTGWTSAEATGQPLSAVFHIINEVTREPVEHPVTKVLRHGRIVGLANHSALVNRSGAVTAIEDSAAPIRDSSGNVIGAVMVFHDVTARRLAESALNESELRFRTIFNQAAVGIAVIDLDGKLLQVNQKFADVFGYTAAELQRLTFLQLTHPDDLAASRATLDRLVTQRATDVVLEKRCLRKDGAVIWSLSTTTMIKEASGRPRCLIGIVEDITKRKLAEEAQARLVAVIASSDDSIISMTLEGVVLSWNRGAELMYGYSPGEMIGHTTAVLIPENRLDEEPAILRRIRAGERIEHFETVRRRKDGGLLDVSIAVSPIEDTRGNIIGASKITRDITESKRAEAALRETDRRKDEFLATLAHELRNPLAPIRQAALISRAEGATEAQKRWSHDVISRQVHHMSLLLDDLLDVSRITRGTLELRLEMADLRDIVDAAVEAARPSIDAKRHCFSAQLPDHPLQILVDPLRMAQILTNLLTNAAKYTDPGGQIELRAHFNDQQVTVAVTDSGIGIPPDAIKSLFEMFSQVKSAQDRSEGGLGIGLALAKGLVELHGGNIEARSAGVGRGSQFIMRLPRRVQDIKSTLDPARGRHVPAAPRRILVADDNRDAAESLAMLLQIDGHELRVEYDGPGAMAAFADFAPQVALLDIGMPGFNGYEVARLVRQREAGNAVVLIALTGWGQERDRERALAAGFDHHFTKPIDPERIHEILRGLV
ncbi:MAG: PAS domain S-box protein [Steroidobacteraceae bacterium]